MQRFQIDRTTIIFVVFLLIIGGIFGVNQLVNTREPLEITVVVSPLSEDWMNAASRQYNNNNVIINGITPVQVSIEVKDDIDIWRGNSGWNSTDHPDAWIPASHLSAQMAPSSLSFETVNDSVATTPLVWGGFQNRVDVITENGTRPFDWDTVQTIASGTSWSDGTFVNMAINWPSGSMYGLGSLTTSVASYAGSGSINRGTVNLTDSDFLAWFLPLEDSLRNSERLGGNPAEVMASRGTGAADFALLPESQWLAEYASLDSNDMEFAYPDYQFPLDFPVLLWADHNTQDVTGQAVTNFANFLSGEGSNIAIENGFRPANTLLDTSATLFTQAQDDGILLELPASNSITLADRSLADNIISLLD